MEFFYGVFLWSFYVVIELLWGVDNRPCIMWLTLAGMILMFYIL